MEFSAQACIKFGWETFKKRPWFFIGAEVLYGAFSWTFGFLNSFAQKMATGGEGAVAAHVVGFLISLLIGPFFTIAMINFLLKAHDDPEHVTISQALHFERYWDFLLAYILVFLIVVGGFILLIVPGVIFGLMYGLTTYIVIDRGLKPMEALRESRRITTGHKWELFLLGVLSVLVLLLGLISFFVGVFVAIPVVCLAYVHAYRTLSSIVSAPAASAATA